jgi:D-arabinose 1-dehydrogenase-like Zn-dependent alcohol dehydrogenase
VRAMAVTAYDRPLELLEIPEPEPRPGYALLEVLACGVCYSDIKISRGRMPFSDRLALPHVPGHEICGRVLRSDPPVLEPGSLAVVYHVFPCRLCARCRAGEDNLCRHPAATVGFTDPGGFQERLLVPVDRLLPVPSGIDPVRAATMTCGLGTAYRAVVTQGRVAPGRRVVVIGLGGVGLNALQIARAASAHAVGLDISQRAVDVARGLGLDARRGDDPDAEEDILRAGGEGVDVVVDVVGREQSIAQACRLVRAGGRIVSVGYSRDGLASVPSARLVLEEVELVGSRYARLDELERAIRLVADGRVETVVDSVRPLERANEAIVALESGSVAGRAVLDVAGVAAS